MVEILKKWTAVIRNHKKRLVMAIAGQSLYQVSTNALDYVVLPALMLKYGPIRGAITYMGVTLAADYLTIVFYDKSQRDILGYEMVKELGGFVSGKKFLKWLNTFLKWVKRNYETNITAKTLFILIMALKFNPFQIVIFMRPANAYHKRLSEEDRFIFFVSYLGGNLYWVFLVGGLVEFLRPHVEPFIHFT